MRQSSFGTAKEIMDLGSDYSESLKPLVEKLMGNFIKDGPGWNLEPTDQYG